MFLATILAYGNDWGSKILNFFLSVLAAYAVYMMIGLFTSEEQKLN